jgi:hypothetical protein
MEIMERLMRAAADIQHSVESLQGRVAWHVRRVELAVIGTNRFPAEPSVNAAVRAYAADLVRYASQLRGDVAAFDSWCQRLRRRHAHGTQPREHLEEESHRWLCSIALKLAGGGRECIRVAGASLRGSLGGILQVDAAVAQVTETLGTYGASVDALEGTALEMLRRCSSDGL